MKKVLKVIAAMSIIIGTSQLGLSARVYTSSSSVHHVYYRDDGNRAMTSASFYRDYAYVEADSGDGVVGSGWSGYSGSVTRYGNYVSAGTFSKHWHYYE